MPSSSLKKLLVVAAAAAIGAVGLLPSPALAATMCGSACDNENPQTYFVKEPGGPSNWWKCSSDARTVDSLGPNDNETLKYFGVTLQLRYSPKCRTVWAKAYGLEKKDTLMVKRYGAGGSQTNTNDSEYGHSPEFQGGKGEMWSPMINDAGYTARACFTPRSHGSTALQVCTRNPY